MRSARAAAAAWHRWGPTLEEKRPLIQAFLRALCHRRAGTRGRHDDLGIAEAFQEPLRDVPRFVLTAGVKRWLSAAGLAVRVVDFVPQPFQQRNQPDADFGVELVNEARDEKGDVQVTCLGPAHQCCDDSVIPVSNRCLPNTGYKPVPHL